MKPLICGCSHFLTLLWVLGSWKFISCVLCCIFSLDYGRIVIIYLLVETHKLAVHILTSHICISNLLSQNCQK
jgi:hypothetical protein